MEQQKYPTEWVRVRQAAEAVNLRAARVYELLKESPAGAIKTITLRSPGAKKGAILISLPSFYAYLDRLAVTQAQEKLVKKGMVDE